MRRLAAAAASLALAAGTGGCTVLGAPGAGDTYPITVYFAKTPSLYERSRVRVLGADAGTITSIESESDRNRVRVRMEIDRDVPVPRDVRATIESANALGERFVTLHPAWTPGRPKAGPGTVVPQERTELPVEIDDALTAFARLNGSIDANRLGGAVGRGADALNGRGDDVNRALQSTATLTSDLAAQDERIVSLAEGLRSLAADLNARDQKLTTLLESFSSTSRTLAEERTRLRDFVAGLAAVIRKSEVLVTQYQETLPAAVTDLSNIVMTLKSNAGSLNQTIEALGRFADVAVQAWDKERNVAAIRLVFHGTVRAWLQPLFDAMGWGTIPCLQGEPTVGNCTKPPKTGEVPR
ncbi:MCE family protein [Spirillospora sp. NPDC029432]|uniref:MCE family protein n=1 Tax=Spirillospora sp. NPDC029432 TaxID=3154599 RepID=UPI0034539E4F